MLKDQVALTSRIMTGTVPLNTPIVNTRPELDTAIVRLQWATNMSGK